VTKILGWHFLKDDGSYCYGNGKPQPDGVETISTNEQPLGLCVWGLHASRNVLDALGHARGALLRRVELSGETLEDNDKMCATRRRELWRTDVTDILHEFGLWCAERALKRVCEAGNEVSDCYWDALEAKRGWLRGEVSDETLDKMQFSMQDAYWHTTDYFATQMFSLAMMQVVVCTLYTCPLMASRSVSYHTRQLVTWLSEDHTAGRREKGAQRRKLLRMVEDARKEKGEILSPQGEISR